MTAVEKRLSKSSYRIKKPNAITLGFFIFWNADISLLINLVLLQSIHISQIAAESLLPPALPAPPYAGGENQLSEQSAYAEST